MSTVIDQWAQAWSIPAAALADLRARYVIATAAEVDNTLPENSEARVQSEVRLAAPRANLLLFRNNVGALLNENGRPIRYGLANDSKQMNQHIKSADLVGIRRVLITQAHLGTVIGQFASVECKWRGWQEGEDKKREKAQKEWATLVQSWGGFAKVTSTCDNIAI